MQIHKKTYAGLGLLILAIVFILQNTSNVDIQFLFWKLSMPRSLMIFFVLVIGAIIGWITALHFLKAHRKKKPH